MSHALNEITFSGAGVEQFTCWPQFLQWLDMLDQRFHIGSIDVQGLDYKPNGDILFGKVAISYTTKDEPHKPKMHYVVYRGAAVVIHFELQTEKECYILGVREHRIAVGLYDSLGLPAGMTDGREDFASVARAELFEEAGISIDVSDLRNVTQEYYGGDAPGVYTSAGLMDEYLQVFYGRREVTESFIENLQGQVHGLGSESERTVLEVIPRRQFGRMSPLASTAEAFKIYYEMLHA